jgi:hypothetical protein
MESQLYEYVVNVCQMFEAEELTTSSLQQGCPALEQLLSL